MEAKTFKSFDRNDKFKCPNEEKICRMYPSFPASCPFGKGKNQNLCCFL